MSVEAEGYMGKKTEHESMPGEQKLRESRQQRRKQVLLLDCANPYLQNVLISWDDDEDLKKEAQRIQL